MKTSAAEKVTAEISFKDRINSALERMKIKKTDEEKALDTSVKKFKEILQQIPNEILSEIVAKPIAYKREDTKYFTREDRRTVDTKVDLTQSFSDTKLLILENNSQNIFESVSQKLDLYGGELIRTKRIPVLTEQKEVGVIFYHGRLSENRKVFLGEIVPMEISAFTEMFKDRIDFFIEKIMLEIDRI